MTIAKNTITMALVALFAAFAMSTSALAAGIISEAEAISIAEAEYSGSGSVTETEQEKEDGVEVWEVEFSDDFEVVIDAITGEVIEAEADEDDDEDEDEEEDDDEDEDEDYDEEEEDDDDDAAENEVSSTSVESLQKQLINLLNQLLSLLSV